MRRRISENPKSLGIQIIQYGSVDGAKNVAEEIASLTGVEIGLKPQPYSTVLVHGVFNKLSLKAIILSRRARIYVMPHGQLARANLRRSWKKAILAKFYIWFLRRAKIVFLNHEEHRHSCLDKRHPDGCLFIPNYVDNDGLGLPPVRQLPPFSIARKISLVFWGRLDVQHKGLDHFLMLAQSIEEKISEIVVIGPQKDDHSRAFLNECSEIFGDRFTHHGYVSRKEIRSKIPKNSVFCLLSRHEGMPLAGLEAMYLGLPAIFSRQTNLLDAFAGGVVDGTPGRPIAEILSDLKLLESRELRAENIRRIDNMKCQFRNGFRNLFRDEVN